MKELLDFGFSLFLTLHILRYSKENNISISEIIELFKVNDIPLESASFVSFGGYRSFTRMINQLKTEVKNEN